MTKLTAESITDEQIRELLAGTIDTSTRREARLALFGAFKHDRMSARARCAAILNARREGVDRRGA